MLIATYGSSYRWKYTALILLLLGLHVAKQENVAERPIKITTLYFTSPVGKKQGSLVFKDDKVYIGKLLEVSR